MNPAFVGAVLFAILAGYHEIRLDRSLANAIESNIKKATILQGNHLRVCNDVEDLLRLLALSDIKQLLAIRCLHVHHLINSWQTMELILDHLEILWFATEHLVEEGLRILYQASVHLVALFG